MEKIKNLMDGYKDFYKEYFVDNVDCYKRLVEDGQSPKTLVISCSDSRVDPSIIFNTKPGDVFVVRNVANLIPPFEDDVSSCHGTSAAIEFAVKSLNVENIIILGHSHCGGIKGFVDYDNIKESSFLKKWLGILLPIKEKISKVESEHICEECEKEGLKVSASNLMGFPFVKTKVDTGSLNVYCAYFCLEEGSLDIYNFND